MLPLIHGIEKSVRYKVICADPPWSFGDKLPGKSRGAEKNYRVLDVVDIEFFLKENEIHVANHALLFLWRVASQVEEAMKVVEEWGFTPKSEIVWVKTSSESAHQEYLAGRMPRLHFGMGRYVRMSHESCIIATRGKGMHLIEDHAVRSVLFAPTGKHSEKPEAFYDLIDKLVPQGPKLELFARRQRKGWTCLGDELP